ncbi:MAG: S8 family serine peptidase, partial [Bdellovibrionales bacterium]|nr:S8 family serine peptidase [Bdellovibrionales bacterium]
VEINRKCYLNQGSSLLNFYSDYAEEFLANRSESLLIPIESRLEQESLVSLAQSDSCVETVSEKYRFDMDLNPNDPRISTQNFHGNTQSFQAWDQFFGTDGIGEEVVIAIIDSGVDLTHDDLKNNKWINPREIPDNNIDDDGNGFVDDVNGMTYAPAFDYHNSGQAFKSGKSLPQTWNFPNGHPCNGTYASEDHGTHVAGLAAAQLNNAIGVAGVMGKKVRIMSLNVFGPYCGTSSEFISAAIHYASANGANIISMSLGGRTGSDPLPADIGSAISQAVNAGAFVLSSAGNTNLNISPSDNYYPAGFARSIDGMVAVGAIDARNSQKCDFSSHSSTGYVELAAPGCNGNNYILSTVLNNGYGVKDGTSMSTPIAAGAAGLVYGLIKSRTRGFPSPAVIEDILTGSGRKHASLEPYFKNGNVVDLVRYYNEVSLRYPVGGPIDGGMKCE